MKSPAGVGRRLPSRLAHRRGSGSGGAGDDPTSGGPSILHWRAPRARGRRLVDDEDDDGADADADAAAAAGGSVEELHFSTEVLPGAAAPRPSPRGGGGNDVNAKDENDLVFVADWDNFSAQPAPVRDEPNRWNSRPSSPEALPTKQRVARRPAPARRTQSVTRGAASPFPGDWPALDNDSTDAVSPPTPAAARLWSAAIPGESSPVRRRGSVSPGPHRRGPSPDRSAARQRSRTQSPGGSARSRNSSFASRQQGAAPSSPPVGSGEDSRIRVPRIQPLSPPQRESHTRPAPQRRLVKVSASDLGLTPREALNPEVVRGVLRRFKSDSGDSLLLSARGGHRSQPHPTARLNPAAPSRTHRSRGLRAASTGDAGGCAEPRRPLQDGGGSVSDERSTESRSVSSRYASPHSHSRRSTSFTERGSSKALSELPGVDEEGDSRKTRRPRRSDSVTRRLRSLSRGSRPRDSQSSAARSAAAPLEGRRSARPAEARSMDRAIHHLPLPSDRQSEPGHAVYNDDDASVPSFGQEERTSRRGKMGRANSRSRMNSRVGLGHESPGRARSGSIRAASEDREQSSRIPVDRHGNASLDQMFVSSGRDRPARGVRRTESGEMLQIIDQLGISSEQLKGLHDLGLTISKV